MAALCVAVGLALGARPAPIVGAIRWDAYFSQPGMPEFEDPNFGAWSLDRQTQSYLTQSLMPTCIYCNVHDMCSRSLDHNHSLTAHSLAHALEYSIAHAGHMLSSILIHLQACVGWGAPLPGFFAVA
jgi:hypothetical protein